MTWWVTCLGADRSKQPFEGTVDFCFTRGFFWGEAMSSRHKLFSWKGDDFGDEKPTSKALFQPAATFKGVPYMVPKGCEFTVP